MNEKVSIKELYEWAVANGIENDFLYIEEREGDFLDKGELNIAFEKKDKDGNYFIL